MLALFGFLGEAGDFIMGVAIIFEEVYGELVVLDGLIFCGEFK